MKATEVPIILAPRYSSYVGEGAFTTVPLDLSDYSTAAIELWRGQLQGSETPMFGVTFQESADGNTWTTIPGGGPDLDPGQGNAAQYALTLSGGLVRMRLVLAGTDVAVSCYAAGAVVLRRS